MHNQSMELAAIDINKVHSLIYFIHCLTEWNCTHSTNLIVMLSDCVITENPQVYNFITDWED